MEFSEVIDMINDASSYIDLYDALTYIEDDELRNSLEDKVTDFETSARELNDTVAYIIDVLNDNIVLNNSDELIDAIDKTGNDKDLVNLLDDIEKADAFEDAFVNDLRQLFRNNRFTVLSDKKDTLIKFIKQYGNVLTESKDIENASFSEILKNKDEQDATDDAVIENNTDTLKLLQKRIGQQMSVGELNTVLQSLFGQYNKVFLLLSDLYNKDLDKTQSVEIKDDGATFIVEYDILDMDKGLIEIKDAKLEESGVE